MGNAAALERDDGQTAILHLTEDLANALEAKRSGLLAEPVGDAWHRRGFTWHPSDTVEAYGAQVWKDEADEWHETPEGRISTYYFFTQSMSQQCFLQWAKTGFVSTCTAECNGIDFAEGTPVSVNAEAQSALYMAFIREVMLPLANPPFASGQNDQQCMSDWNEMCAGRNIDHTYMPWKLKELVAVLLVVDMHAIFRSTEEMAEAYFETMDIYVEERKSLRSGHGSTGKDQGYITQAFGGRLPDSPAGSAMYEELERADAESMMSSRDISMVARMRNASGRKKRWERVANIGTDPALLVTHTQSKGKWRVRYWLSKGVVQRMGVLVAREVHKLEASTDGQWCEDLKAKQSLGAGTNYLSKAAYHAMHEWFRSGWLSTDLQGHNRMQVSFRIHKQNDRKEVIRWLDDYVEDLDWNLSGRQQRVNGGSVKYAKPRGFGHAKLEEGAYVVCRAVYLTASYSSTDDPDVDWADVWTANIWLHGVRQETEILYAAKLVAHAAEYLPRGVYRTVGQDRARQGLPEILTDRATKLDELIRQESARRHDDEEDGAMDARRAWVARAESAVSHTCAQEARDVRVAQASQIESIYSGEDERVAELGISSVNEKVMPCVADAELGGWRQRQHYAPDDPQFVEKLGIEVNKLKGYGIDGAYYVLGSSRFVLRPSDVFAAVLRLHVPDCTHRHHLRLSGSTAVRLARIDMKAVNERVCRGCQDAVVPTKDGTSGLASDIDMQFVGNVQEMQEYVRAIRADHEAREAENPELGWTVSVTRKWLFPVKRKSLSPEEQERLSMQADVEEWRPVLEALGDREHPGSNDMWRIFVPQLHHLHKVHISDDPRVPMGVHVADVMLEWVSMEEIEQDHLYQMLKRHRMSATDETDVQFSVWFNGVLELFAPYRHRRGPDGITSWKFQAVNGEYIPGVCSWNELQLKDEYESHVEFYGGNSDLMVTDEWNPEVAGYKCNPETWSYALELMRTGIPQLPHSVQVLASQFGGYELVRINDALTTSPCDCDQNLALRTIHIDNVVRKEGTGDTLGDRVVHKLPAFVLHSSRPRKAEGGDEGWYAEVAEQANEGPLGRLPDLMDIPAEGGGHSINFTMGAAGEDDGQPKAHTGDFDMTQHEWKPMRDGSRARDR